MNFGKKKYLFTSLIITAVITTSCSVMPDNSYSGTKITVPYSKIIAEAESFLGVPYKYGGADKYGMDCSGFVVRVYKKTFHISLPHNTSQLYNLGMNVSSGQLHTGDLVFFRSGSSAIYHVGIYLKNSIFIHASSSRGVIKSNIKAPYYKKRFIAAKRIIKGS